MNIILFGPPGIGKSTLIGVLKTLGQRAIDLEDLYPNRSRFQVNNWVEETYIGAADLSPQHKYSNAIKVLLYADQDAYDKRRAQRDRQFPGKGNQMHHNIDDWTQAQYDYIVNTTNMDTEHVAQVLISLMNEKGGHRSV
jgi:broad-specificity NMP kinase